MVGAHTSDRIGSFACHRIDCRVHICPFNRKTSLSMGLARRAFCGGAEHPVDVGGNRFDCGNSGGGCRIPCRRCFRGSRAIMARYLAAGEPTRGRYTKWARRNLTASNPPRRGIPLSSPRSICPEADRPVWGRREVGQQPPQFLAISGCCPQT
jgi:hypothetical protein